MARIGNEQPLALFRNRIPQPSASSETAFFGQHSQYFQFDDLTG